MVGANAVEKHIGIGHVFMMTGAVPKDRVALRLRGPRRQRIHQNRSGLVAGGPDRDMAARAVPLSLGNDSSRGLRPLGDVRRGNIKRVASAVGEGSIAVAFVHRVLHQVTGSEEGCHDRLPLLVSTPHTITVSDGTQIYFKDWRSGPACCFSHGWPLERRRLGDQMVFLGLHGYRCIAHDRRGHGRSSQTWNGNEMDTSFADDLAALLKRSTSVNAIHVGHSTGGGEVARYVVATAPTRVCQAVPIGAVPPLMLKTAAKTGGLPIETSTRFVRASGRTGRSSLRT